MEWREDSVTNKGAKKRKKKIEDVCMFCPPRWMKKKLGCWREGPNTSGSTMVAMQVKVVSTDRF